MAKKKQTKLTKKQAKAIIDNVWKEFLEALDELTADEYILKLIHDVSKGVLFNGFLDDKHLASAVANLQTLVNGYVDFIKTYLKKNNLKQDMQDMVLKHKQSDDPEVFQDVVTDSVLLMTHLVTQNLIKHDLVKVDVLSEDITSDITTSALFFKMDVLLRLVNDLHKMLKVRLV